MKKTFPFFKKAICFQVLLCLFLFQSCHKENVIEMDSSHFSESEKAQVRTDLFDNDPVTTRLREITTNHLKYDISRDPLYYFPEGIREQFDQEYKKHQAELEAIGLAAYLEQQQQAGNIAASSVETLLAFKPAIEKVGDGLYEEAIDNLIEKRSNLKLASVVANEHLNMFISLHDILISIVQDVINNDDKATLRSPCSIRDFIDDIIDGVAVGTAVGTAVGVIFDFANGDGGPLQVTIRLVGETVTLAAGLIGGIVGGIIGGISSLFRDGNCDCGPATGVRVSIIDDMGDPCNPTYRLFAFGAGSDAELFNWTVNEGNSNAFYPSEPALLGPPPTQNSPAVPLFVNVVTLCPQDLDDEEAMIGNTLVSQEVNLFDAYAEVEEVGDVLVYNDFNQTISGTIEISQSVNAPKIRPSSTNGGTLRNTFTIQFLPGSFGSSTTTGEDEFLLFISGSVGTEGTFRVRGTNNCSGAISDLLLDYVIVP